MKILKLKKNNIKSLFKHLKKNFKKKHIFFNNIELFNWQYFNKKNYNFFVLIKNKKVEAAQGYIKTSRYDNQLLNDTVFLSIWSSSIASLGAKVFFELTKKIKSNIIAGLASSDKSFLFQKLLKFNCFYMDHYFMTSNKKNKRLIHPSSFSNYKKSKYKKNFKQLLNKQDILNIGETIFQHQVPKKTSVYLINRYLEHPFYKYLIFSIGDSFKTEAIFVLRLCEYKNKFALRIVDFIGPNLAFPKGKYLFDHLLNIFSAEYIDIYSFGIQKKFLQKSNLEDVKRYKNKVIVPNYFEPFVKKNIEIPLAFKLKNKSLINKVRFFKGDSDLDRPNIIL